MLQSQTERILIKSRTVGLAFSCVAHVKSVRCPFKLATENNFAIYIYIYIYHYKVNVNCKMFGHRIRLVTSKPCNHCAVFVTIYLLSLLCYILNEQIKSCFVLCCYKEETESDPAVFVTAVPIITPLVNSRGGKLSVSTLNVTKL